MQSFRQPAKPYFAYAELLFTLSAIMWVGMWQVEATPETQVARAIELIFFGIVCVGALCLGAAKAHLKAKDFPWLAPVVVVYCVLMGVFLFFLGGFPIVKLLAILVAVLYAFAVHRLTSR